MDAFSDPKVRELCGVWASQIGKTDTVLNMIAHRIALAPGPMLLIQPTLGMAEDFSKDRLAPMLRDTPALRGKVADARSRDSGNTILHKLFPGGHFTMAGANSPASLASRPIRDVFFDEVDRYAVSAGTEGDPVKLAETRTRAFWNAKKVYISSPGTKGASRIEVVWERSDQRRYFVPCHACGHEQALAWARVVWDKDPDTGEHLPATARYECERCGAAWSDVQRWASVRRGAWRATKAFRGVAGFHVNALAAPWESCKLERLVEQWLEAQGNPELLKVFTNTVLAEWWEEQYEALDETGLLARRELYPERAGELLVPRPVALLTAGVDVQDTRLEVTVDGWGSGEECWRIAHEVLWGDPSTPALWDALEAFLLRPWRMERGGVDWIRGAAVDTGGHFTQAAYDFCGPRFRRYTPDGGQAFVYAIKGQDGAGEVWPRVASRATTKVPLWQIRVGPAKEQIYGRLSILDHGPGFVHFPLPIDGADFPAPLEAAYFEGLTAEKVVTRVNRQGFPVRRWELRRAGLRNEPLDCAVYSYAAFCGLRAMGVDLELEAAGLADRPVIELEDVTADEVPAPAARREGDDEGPRPPRGGGGGSWLGTRRDWLRRR